MSLQIWLLRVPLILKNSLSRTLLEPINLNKISSTRLISAKRLKEKEEKEKLAQIQEIQKLSKIAPIQTNPIASSVNEDGGLRYSGNDNLVNELGTYNNGRRCHNTRRGMFHHQRRARVEFQFPNGKIVYKKKDSIPNVYPTLKERLDELDLLSSDVELYSSVNIGMGVLDSETPEQKKRRQRSVLSNLKSNKSLVKLARDRKLTVDVKQLQHDWLYGSSGVSHTTKWAKHCAIYEHLFGPCAHFDNIVPITAHYEFDEDSVSPVFRGNVIKPDEASSEPTVQWTSSPDDLWTLALTNPDGDLYKSNSECLHWMITNIKGSDLRSGSVIAPYLPPVPPRGVGYQRMVFVLYKQTEPIDATTYTLSDNINLRERSFSTAEFYRTFESQLTPVGLSWYSSDWDSSVSRRFHTQLGMKEPIFEYEFPKPYITEEKRYPKGRNFLFYMDMHRDQKQIASEILMKRLRRLDPFQLEATDLPYPHAQPVNFRLPTWQIQEIKKERLGWGKYRNLYNNEYKAEVFSDDQLRAAATVEVEKNHSLRLGSQWKKTHIGKKKRNMVTALEEQQEADKL